MLLSTLKNKQAGKEDTEQFSLCVCVCVCVIWDMAIAILCKVARKGLIDKRLKEVKNLALQSSGESIF